MAFLTLSDGTQYSCSPFGAIKDTIGEVVFNTAMVGYQELITDPANTDKIVLLTYPLIGNYGIVDGDGESDSPKIKGLIAKDFCRVPSNWRMTDTLENHLTEYGLPAVEKFDTRALTRKLRESGAVYGLISQDKPTEAQLEELKNYPMSNKTEKQGTKCIYDLPSDSGKRLAFIDFGATKSAINAYSKSGFAIRVFPSSCDAEEIAKYNPSGIVLSNGPENPYDYIKEIELIKQFIGKTPIYATGLGHQLLALSYGAKLERLKGGHRGCNLPVKRLQKGNVIISSQNHAYTVIESSLNKGDEVTHVNWNDKSVEGIEYADGMSYSVQFNPESLFINEADNCLFDKFLNAVEK